MGRPREFDPERALEQAMLAFWQHGYLGTGIQELVDTTGVNRASLYGAFGNKQQLFLTALERYTERCVADLASAFAPELSPAEGFRAMLTRYLEGLAETRRGCLLNNTALEDFGTSASIRNAVRAGLGRIEAMLAGKAEAGLRRGDLDPHQDAVTIARLIMATLHSMTIHAKAGAPRTVLENLRDGIMAALEPRPAR